MFFSQKERFMLPVQTHKKKLLSLLCLLGLTALTCCTTKSNRFGIVLISNEVAGPADIYRIPDNTQSKLEQLTFTPTIGEYYLLVSKNGDKIVFVAGPTSLVVEPSESAIEKREHIYLLDAVSKKLEDITEIFSSQPFGAETSAADWSPDQKQFAIITYEGDVGIMNFDGSNKNLISFPSLGDIPNIGVVKWSPDGKKLALTRGVVGLAQRQQTPGSELLIYDLESGELTKLADYHENCYRPTWSPTSHQVVATCANVLPHTNSVAPNAVRIFSVENPGQPYERLALSPCLEPSWSPDGKQIAFACYKGTDQMGLFIINSDGHGIREVRLGNLGSPAILRCPIWSPDGTQILYVAGTDAGHSNVYSVNPDGSNNHALTNHEAFYRIISVYPVP
jgi:Tol biopolymer transport system component